MHETLYSYLETFRLLSLRRNGLCRKRYAVSLTVMVVYIDKIVIFNSHIETFKNTISLNCFNSKAANFCFKKSVAHLLQLLRKTSDPI